MQGLIKNVFYFEIQKSYCKWNIESYDNTHTMKYTAQLKLTWQVKIHIYFFQSKVFQLWLYNFNFIQ